MRITKQTIKNIIEEKNGIAKLVLQDMFDRADYSKETQKQFQEAFLSSFNDLLNYGSNNGIIARLIYYKDTHAFFDEHYDEIEGLRDEWQQSTGETIEIKGDLKDFFARFGYETVARNLAETIFPDTF
jgi:hypothetical protein